MHSVHASSIEYLINDYDDLNDDDDDETWKRVLKHVSMSDLVHVHAC